MSFLSKRGKVVWQFSSRPNPFKQYKKVQQFSFEKTVKALIMQCAKLSLKKMKRSKTKTKTCFQKNQKNGELKKYIDQKKKHSPPLGLSLILPQIIALLHHHLGWTFKSAKASPGFCCWFWPQWPRCFFVFFCFLMSFQTQWDRCVSELLVIAVI